MRFIILIFFLFICNNSFSQKIYSTKYKSQADINVFVTEYKSQADLLVFRVDYISQAKQNNGLHETGETPTPVEGNGNPNPEAEAEKALAAYHANS